MILPLFLTLWLCATLEANEGPHNMVVNVLAVNDNDELNVVQGSDGIFGLQSDASKNKSTTAAPKPENCKDLHDQGNTVTKWYTVYTQDGSSISVYCDMDTDGGGWLVFQRRVDGSVDFYRGWSDYKSGFGSGGSEFWLGNDNINTLTSAGNYELRIDMRDVNSNSWFMTYSSFKINAESDNYRLNLGSPSSGNAGDYLSYNNQASFSTYDRDNDDYNYYYYYNCASNYQGAWWYKSCTYVNLNGYYYPYYYYSGSYGINWPGVSYYSLKFVEMKIRPQ
ncbi:ficolin-1-A [Amia ocellicauda]|uniref:ficolin-1-A n=1 Tax=Amia ocellicauda TaxID=2972642 RepID=UPI003463CCAC